MLHRIKTDHVSVSQHQKGFHMVKEIIYMPVSHCQILKGSQTCLFYTAKFKRDHIYVCFTLSKGITCLFDSAKVNSVPVKNKQTLPQTPTCVGVLERARCACLRNSSIMLCVSAWCFLSSSSTSAIFSALCCACNSSNATCCCFWACGQQHKVTMETNNSSTATAAGPADICRITITI